MNGEIDKHDPNKLIFAAAIRAEQYPFGTNLYKRVYLLSMPLNETRTTSEQEETAKYLNSMTDSHIIHPDSVSDMRFVPEYHGVFDGLQCFIQWKETFLLCRTIHGLELYEKVTTKSNTYGSQKAFQLKKIDSASFDLEMRESLWTRQKEMMIVVEDDKVFVASGTDKLVRLEFNQSEKVFKQTHQFVCGDQIQLKLFMDFDDWTNKNLILCAEPKNAASSFLQIIKQEDLTVDDWSGNGRKDIGGKASALEMN